jgi:hypothetical protein
MIYTILLQIISITAILSAELTIFDDPIPSGGTKAPINEEEVVSGLIRQELLPQRHVVYKTTNEIVIRYISTLLAGDMKTEEGNPDIDRCFPKTEIVITNNDIMTVWAISSCGGVSYLGNNRVQVGQFGRSVGMSKELLDKVHRIVSVAYKSSKSW